ncbi:hypothetical protein N9L68_07460 [bacterium]|nr:hypothetical protein [bacterium]
MPGRYSARVERARDVEQASALLSSGAMCLAGKLVGGRWREIRVRRPERSAGQSVAEIGWSAERALSMASRRSEQTTCCTDAEKKGVSLIS